MNKFAFLLLALWVALSPAGAQPVRVDAVEVELVADRDAAVPGAPLTLGLRIRHDPHWHTYWRFAGDSGLPTRLELRLPEGWQAGAIAWPAPERINIGPLGNYGYEGDAVLPVPVTVPASAATGSVALAGRAQWLMCREVCIPGEAEVRLTLPLRERAGPSAHAPLFERAAAAAPAGRIAAQLRLHGGRWSLAFERAEAGAVEFFPYREGLVAAAAPQPLYRLGEPGAGRWRLALAPAEAGGAGAGAHDPAPWFGEPAGLLVIDGRAYEVDAAPADAAPAAGTLVSTAVGREAGGVGGRGRLSGLLAGSDEAAGAAAGGAAEATGLAIAALFGIVGGLLLNLMPCVFPVIGLKVLGFAAHANGGGARQRAGALAFGAGVLASFWALAGLLLALRAAGQSVGWGFQLQSPAFVAAMALLFVVMGLNFAGVFEIGAGLTRLGGADPLHGGRGGVLRSFGSGMVAVLVATPCTAPFMGSALGYTLGRPAIELLVVFSAIAAGMASPYVLLGLFPAALRWLPRPGRWMESFRQFLAFPMFATVAWLVWVLGQQAGIDAVLALAIGAVLVALAAWLHGRFVQSSGAVHRGLAAVLAIASLLAGLWVAWPADAPARDAGPASSAAPAGGPARTLAWEPWSEARVAEAVAAGRTVFVDFTAAWCVSCQANKRLALERDAVVSRMAQREVLRLRADWTNRDEAITRELARHGRNGVPLYLVYRPGEPRPRVLPEILTPGIVLDAIGG